MDRQQKIEQVASEGRLVEISGLTVEYKNIHPDYACEQCDGRLGETGKLELLKLAPTSGNGPYFIARWDHKAATVDIDMHNASDERFQALKGTRTVIGVIIQSDHRPRMSKNST